MSGTQPDPPPSSTGLLDLYDRALPVVYGYLVSRVGDRSTAEELTSEVFLAAVDAVRRPTGPEIDTGWLVGVARHKLVDHWRRAEREQRSLRAVAAEPDPPGDTWDVRLDALTARDVLAGLAPQHRSVLTLRYVDGLPVRAVAELLDRTEGATEVLLVRAKAAFRAAYPTEEGS